MITLAAVIDQFEADFLRGDPGRLHSNQISALQAMKNCRTAHSPVMQVNCTDWTVIIKLLYRIPVDIATVHIVSTTRASNGLNDRCKGRYLPIIL